MNGLLFLVPVVLTVYVFYLVFVKIDGWLGIPVPGLGFVITLVLITLVGFLASNFLTRGLLSWVDGLFNRLPLVRLLYSSVKDLIGAFVGEKKRFDKPVLVSLFPEANAYVLGFITRESLRDFGLNDLVAVYLPQSYNFAGNLVVVPRNQVRPLNANSSEVMTFIVSGGVAGR